MTGKYDARGNQITAAYFDQAGKPARHKDGYALATARYDAAGRRTELAYFDEEGKPTRHRDGNHVWTARYDDRGREVEHAFLDEKRQPVRLTGGYSRVTFVYARQGFLAEKSWWGYDPVKEGYHRLTARFDVRGNQIEDACFDSDGKPALNTFGYFKCVTKYDERGRETEAVYHGRDGKPAPNERGYVRRITRYDSSGKPIDASHFDRDGKPVKTRVLVNEVVAGGQGEHIGLRVGDVLLDYDGKEVTNMYRFVHVRSLEPSEGAARELKVLRKGKIVLLRVKPGRLGAQLTDRVISIPEK